MEQVLRDISSNFDHFLLMFLRTSALIISSPIFGRKNVPNTVKIAFCVLVTYVTFTSFSSHAEILYSNVVEFSLLCIKELLYGMVLGFVTTMFFGLVQTSGHVIDMMMGFGMVDVFDVQNNVKVPISGTLLYTVLVITFFMANAHLQLIHILNITFTQVPVGFVTLNPKIGLVALEVFVLAFVMSVNVALPLIASGFLGEVLMGIVIRSVPQMNIFVVGLPLKVALGFLMLVLVLPIYVNYTDVIFMEMFNSIDKMFQGLAGT